VTDELFGDVAAKVDGRDFVLNFSVRAIRRLEAVFGRREGRAMTVEDIGRMWRTDKSIDFICTMFWGSLIWRQPEFNTVDPEVGMDTAGELMRRPGGELLPMLLVEAWAVSWPIPPLEGDGPVDPQTRPETAGSAGTGAVSSGSGSKTTSGRRKRS